MPRLTRSASTASCEGDVKAEVKEEKVEAGSVAESSGETQCLSLLIGPVDVAELTFLKLPHPRTSQPSLYAASSTAFYEVLRVEKLGSAFVGERVVKDGAPALLSPLHPLLVALPHLIANAKERWVPVDQLLECSAFPDAERLSEQSRLVGALPLACEAKDIADDLTVYRWSEEKTLQWLGGKVHKLQGHFKETGEIHSAILADEAALLRYSWGLVSDWLPADLSAKLKMDLGVVEPSLPLAPTQDPSSATKRTASAPAAAAVAEKKAKGPTTAQKRLQKASSGTKSLNAFFKPKA